MLVKLYAERGDRKFEQAALNTCAVAWNEEDPSLLDVAQVVALLAEGDLMMRGQ